MCGPSRRWQLLEHLCITVRPSQGSRLVLNAIAQLCRPEAVLNALRCPSRISGALLAEEDSTRRGVVSCSAHNCQMKKTCARHARWRLGCSSTCTQGCLSGTRRVCLTGEPVASACASQRNPSRTGMPTLEECPRCFLGCFAGALTYSKQGSSVQCTCPKQWSCCFHKDPKAPACRAVRLMAPVSKITGL